MVKPGIAGNMYARIGAPSNGKYAKKTKPSAENGMTFYQHGLDFVTKGMENGGNIFVYGTLKDQNLLDKVVGHHLPEQPATLS